MAKATPAILKLSDPVKAGSLSIVYVPACQCRFAVNGDRIGKGTMTMEDRLKREIDDRLANGSRQVTVAQMGREFLALGYKLDRAMDCRCNARYMTGPRAGESYPCITTSVREISTGLRFAHCQAGRGDNFKAMQKLRGEIFAVTRGAILEV